MYDVYGSRHNNACGKKECRNCGMSEASRSHARDLARDEIKLLLESKRTPGGTLKLGGGDRNKVEWSKKANPEVLSRRSMHKSLNAYESED